MKRMILTTGALATILVAVLLCASLGVDASGDEVTPPTDASDGSSISYIVYTYDVDAKELSSEPVTADVWTDVGDERDRLAGTTWEPGIYYVDSNVSFDNDITLDATGEGITIVIADGVTFKVDGAIRFDGTLNICSTSGGSGAGSLVCDGINNSDASANIQINIHGCKIRVDPVGYNSGIGSGHKASGTTEISIYDGDIEVTSESFSSRYGASIGSGGQSTGETRISIYGGDIRIKPTDYGAGIGSGYYSTGDTWINIYDGDIATYGEPYAAMYGAGIGSGNYASGDTWISIHGGSIEAESVYGAGIGTGRSASGTTQIDIYDGEVHNDDIREGAGIGSGRLASGTTEINIYDGFIDVSLEDKTYCWGSFIGSGYNSEGDVVINISNGCISVVGNLEGAGIGSGYSSDGTVTINIDGGHIHAVGYADGAAIGAGNVSDSTTRINISDGKIEAEGADGAGIGAGVDAMRGNIVKISGGTVNTNLLGLASNPHSKSDSSLTITGGTVNADRIIWVTNQTYEVKISGGNIQVNQISGSGDMDLSITDGYVYADSISGCTLSVSGGGALFHRGGWSDVTDNTDYVSTEEDKGMVKYDLSQVYENLNLYYEAYDNGQGYPYVIDHFHNTSGRHHVGGQYDHWHCGVPRWDKPDDPWCDYSPEVSHHDFEWINNGDGTHSQRCKSCGYTLTSDHVQSDHEDAGDGLTHTYFCVMCSSYDDGNHDYTGHITDDHHHLRVCKQCGHTERSQDVVQLRQDGDYHVWYCTTCGELGKELHDFVWTDNGDGTHTGVCSICDAVRESVPHNYVNGICEDCGAIHPGLIGGNVDDYYPPAWGYDDIQDVNSKEKEEWIAIAVAATAATIMAIFLIWDRRKS